MIGVRSDNRLIAGGWGGTSGSTAANEIVPQKLGDRTANRRDVRLRSSRHRHPRSDDCGAGMTPARLVPFSDEEREGILAAVRRHEQLRQVLEGRGRTIAVEAHFTARGDESQAVVAIYDYDEDRTLVASVNPEAGRVVSVEESPASFQLSDEERREAESLAAEHEDARRFLAGRDANPLTRLYFPPHAPPHRYAVVFLRPNSSERAYVVVDLSQQRGVETRRREDLAI